MLMKTAFAVLAAVIATGPVAGSGVAQAQSSVNLQCWHDGDPKHFRPECRDPEKIFAVSKVKKDASVPNIPRNQAEFDPDNLFDQMMRDSGGGAGGGGGR